MFSAKFGWFLGIPRVTPSLPFERLGSCSSRADIGDSKREIKFSVDSPKLAQRLRHLGFVEAGFFLMGKLSDFGGGAEWKSICLLWDSTGRLAEGMRFMVREEVNLFSACISNEMYKRKIELEFQRKRDLKGEKNYKPSG